MPVPSEMTVPLMTAVPIAACVVALLWWGCCGRRRRTIPFVGAAGIVLIGWAALQFLRLWL